MNWDAWARLTAKDRMIRYAAATEEFLAAQEPESSSLCKPMRKETHWIIKELLFGGENYCDNCDEQVPELLTFEADDDALERSSEKAAIIDMSVEWNVCAQCIAYHKQPHCTRCGFSQSMVLANPDCDKFEQGTYGMPSKLVTHPDGHDMKAWDCDSQ